MTFAPIQQYSYADAALREQQRRERANQPYKQSLNLLNQYKQWDANNREGQELAALAQAVDPKGPLAQLVISRELERRNEEAADHADEERHRLAESITVVEQKQLAKSVQLESELKAEAKKSQAVATKANQNNAPYDVVEQLNVHKGTTKAVLIAKTDLNTKLLGQSTYYADKFANDTRIINVPGMAPFRINSPDLNIQQKKAALAFLSHEYIKETGVAGYDKMFLHRHFWPGFNKTEASYMKAYRKQYAIDQGEILREEALSQLGDKDFNIGDILSQIRGTKNRKEQPFSYAESWNSVKERIKNIAKTNPEEAFRIVRQLEKQDDPQWSGSTIGEKREHLIDELEEFIEKETIGEINEDTAKREAVGDDIVNEAADLITQNPEATEEDLEPLKIKAIETTGTIPDGFNDLITKAGYNQKELIKSLEAVAIKQPNGKLPPYMYKGFPDAVIIAAKNKGIIMTRDEYESSSVYWKKAKDDIEAYTRKGLGAVVLTEATTDLYTRGIFNAEEYYRTRMQQEAGPKGRGLPEGQAHDKIMLEIKDKFKLEGETVYKGASDSVVDSVLTSVEASEFFQPNVPLSDSETSSIRNRYEKVVRDLADREPSTADWTEEEKKAVEAWDGKGEAPSILRHYSRALSLPPSVVKSRHFDPKTKVSEEDNALANDPRLQILRPLLFGKSQNLPAVQQIGEDEEQGGNFTW